jgi:GTP-binding protein HflX
VTDAGAEQRDAQMAAVREVLHDIGAAATPSVTVFNQIDRVDAEDRRALENRFPNAEFVSALHHEGLESLLARIADEAAKGSSTLTVLIPYTRGDVVALAHERAQIDSERHVDTGTQLVLRVPQDLAPAFEPFCVQPEDPAE